MTHTVDAHIGQRIRALRFERKISQAELAKRCGAITFQQIQKYERGSNRVSGSRLWMISQALGVPVALFYEGLPQDVATETPEGRARREYAESLAGRVLLDAARAIPQHIVASHVDTMHEVAVALAQKAAPARGESEGRSMSDQPVP